MKNTFPPLLLLFFLTVFSCSKKDNCEDPIDCLPAITQTGEGTIGCLINGKPFSPGGSQLGGPTQQAFYQYVDGGYHFGLSANNRRGDKNESINISINDDILESDLKFILEKIEADANNYISNFGEYSLGATRYHTNENHDGEIIFTKFGNGIVSGTFWFDAVNEEGEVVEIREGRFDMKL